MFALSALALIATKTVRVHLPPLVRTTILLLGDILLLKTIILQKWLKESHVNIVNIVLVVCLTKIFLNKTHMSSQHWFSRTNVATDTASGEGPAQSDTPTETPGSRLTPVKEPYNPSNALCWEGFVSPVEDSGTQSSILAGREELVSVEHSKDNTEDKENDNNNEAPGTLGFPTPSVGTVTNDVITNLPCPSTPLVASVYLYGHEDSDGNNEASDTEGFPRPSAVPVPNNLSVDLPRPSTPPVASLYLHGLPYTWLVPNQGIPPTSRSPSVLGKRCSSHTLFFKHGTRPTTLTMLSLTPLDYTVILLEKEETETVLRRLS